MTAVLRERELKRKMFYASLGECITSWAAIERELFELFHRALGVESRWQTKSRKTLTKRSQRYCSGHSHIWDAPQLYIHACNVLSRNR